MRIVVVLIVLLAGLSASSAAAARPALRVGIAGGRPGTATLCGGTRQITTAAQGDRLAVRVSAKRIGTGRTSSAARRVLLVRSQACDGPAGTSRTLLARRAVRDGPVSVEVGLPPKPAGAYRITAELRTIGGRSLARRATYLRVEETLIDAPVRFSVTNSNRSKLPCSSDGQPYTVAGRLVAPRSALTSAKSAATLYLHEFGWGTFFFSFPRADYDYALQAARAGHVSVVVDRLGYDTSSHPPGLGTCLGSQADIAHQIVQELRAGHYSATGTAPVAFRHLALAGHSAGGAISELEAYSFADVDAVLLFAYADQDFTNSSTLAAGQQGQHCLTGGEPAEPGGPGGYAYFGATPEEWKHWMFTSAEPSVADLAARMRNRDPCGDVGSFVPTVLSDHLHVQEITVPVLLLYGKADAVYDEPAAGQDQQQLFSGSKDVTLRFFDGTGHALTLERSAPALRGVVFDWLARRGF